MVYLVLYCILAYYVAGLTILSSMVLKEYSKIKLNDFFEILLLSVAWPILLFLYVFYKIRLDNTKVGRAIKNRELRKRTEDLESFIDEVERPERILQESKDVLNKWKYLEKRV